MHHLKYRITTQAPIVLTARAGDMNMTATERTLPGSAVLGVLAKRVITKRKLEQTAHTDPVFYHWFLAGNLKIGNAFIVSEDQANKEYRYLPVPFSIRKKKYQDAAQDFLFVEEDPKVATEAIKAFCVIEDETLRTRTVETRFNFHHARNRELGITEKGRIFTYESIAPEQSFEGRISGTKEELQKLLDICGTSWDGHLGRSRNAQYGKIWFEFVNDQPQEDPLLEIKTQQVALTLLSDTIIYNQYGYATTELKTLKAYLEAMLDTEVMITTANMKQGCVETFVGVWQLRTPSETCFLAGSACLLELERCDPEHLLKLQAQGIGERTHEGFGQCRVNWQRTAGPFTVIAERDQAASVVLIPECSMPDGTKAILKTLLRETLKKRIRKEAVKDQDTFRNLPSNSVLARLEALVKASTRLDFVDRIYQLRQTARIQLERCRGTRMTLFHMLTGRFVITDQVLATLKAEGLPEELLDKLATIKEQPEIRPQTFLEVLRETLGEAAAAQYASRISQSAFSPNHILAIAPLLQPAEQTLCQQLEYSPATDPELEHELFALYFGTFFHIMRKRTTKE